MPQLVQVFEQVAAGLVHMHRRGVYHADLKPNNIMLSRAGEVKIIDYGLAWIKGEPKDRVQGTPEYMAPETGQAQARSTSGPTSTTSARPCTACVTLQAAAERRCRGRDSLRIGSKAFKAMLTPVGELNKAVPSPLCDLIHGA